MKKVGLALVALALPSAALASVKIETQWGNRCNDNSYTMAVKGRNDKTYNADIRLCMKSKNGRWTCWVSTNVKPGAWTPNNWNYYVCSATGDYFWSSRPSNRPSIKFDDPPGYKRGY